MPFMCDINTVENFLCREAALILNRDEQSIKPESPFLDLGLESMSFVELLICIEKEYNIKLINSGLDTSDLASISSLAQRVVKELDNI